MRSAEASEGRCEDVKGMFNEWKVDLESVKVVMLWWDGGYEVDWLIV